VREKYFPTGNEYIALPSIREKDGAIEQVNVLHMGTNGLLSFSGGTLPFLTPRLTINDEELFLAGQLTWEREADWLPRFRMKGEGFELGGLYFCPPGQRGFVLSLKLNNLSTTPLYCGLAVDLVWNSLLHTINMTKALRGDRFLVAKTAEEMPAMEFRSPAPLVTLAPYPPDKSSRFFFRKGLQALNPASRDVLMAEGEALTLHWLQSKEVQAGAFWECFFYFGAGIDEIGATSAARDLQRTGGRALQQQTLEWLNARRKKSKEPELEPRMNLNAFFNHFYATGITLDTEEVVSLTSRSPRYPAGGSYSDRDALLWSFPALLAWDSEWAKRVLGYIFSRQGKNFGMRSRYLTGGALEPEFGLDELCAPVIALKNYLEATKDLAFLNRPDVRECLEGFEKQLALHKHPQKEIYLSRPYPRTGNWPQRCSTYDNVMVWKALTDLSQIYRSEKNFQKTRKCLAAANALKGTVMRQCVTKTTEGRRFAWMVDLRVKGTHITHDHPRRSLLLLPFYGFCPLRHPVWKRTREWIYSQENPRSFAGQPFEQEGTSQSPHPWVASAVSSLLIAQKERALKFLKTAPMDNGIACESVDEKTGEAVTGEAYAACAGFLAYGLWHVLGKKPKIKKKLRLIG
jgi:uncharacterized protein